MGAPLVPTVELRAPDGRRVVVAPQSVDDRLGELADALGLDPGHDLELDGRPVGREVTLANAGLTRGSRLAATAPANGADGADDSVAPVALVVGDGGPAAGVVVAIGPGRHVVGRSPLAAVALSDDSLEPHHVLLDVGENGAVVLTQLTGRVPTRIDDDPVAGPTRVPDGAVVALGASRLRIGVAPDARPAPAALSVTPADPWRRTLHRTPRPQERWDPEPVALPAPSPPRRFSSGIGLTAALCTMLGSLVVALVMRSPMFLLLGAVGIIAALAMCAAGRISEARDGRRATAARRDELASFAAGVAEQRAARWRHHLATTPTVADAIVAATTFQEDVWSRRADHGDGFRVTLGWGPVDWQVTTASPLADADVTIAAELHVVIAAAERFEDAPVATDLGPGAALAISGPLAAAATRSIVAQLATWTGPADWHLVVVTDELSSWEWCSWLPHGDGGSAAVLAADDPAAQSGVLQRLLAAEERHVIVVTDRPDLLAQRTGPLRRFLGAGRSAAVVACVPAGETVPAMCSSVLEIGSIGRAKWWPDASAAGRTVTVHAAGVTATDASRVAAALARLRDPEDPAAAADALARSVTFSVLSERHGAGPIDDAIAIAASWRGAGADPPPVAPVGLTADGLVEIDLARDGPHALIAGTTGSGKSELLRTLVVSLAARCSPDHLTFVLVDYKGGSTFDACADLPHTVGLVTDLDDRLAERALLSLDAELRHREQLLRAVAAADLTEYRRDADRRPIPRLAVVIDEFATLAAELPTFMSALVGIAQRGRSLGVHLVLATQRPQGVVDDDIRANTNLRLALRLVDPSDGRDVVGDEAPARFPRAVPGRTMLRLGPSESVVFQCARCTAPMMPSGDDGLRVLFAAELGAEGDGQVTELDVLVRSIRHAAALSDVAAPRRPWLPPLPTHLDAATTGGAIGLVDVPSAQRQDDLRWSPSTGHLALLGGFGSGTTTAMLAALLAACRTSSPEQLHVYVIDARGDDRLGVVGGFPHCGAIVRPHERERLTRLLDRLIGELERRMASGAADRPAIVCAVDGVAALRAMLDEPTDHPRWDQLVRIVTEGAALGITCVLTAERPGALPPAVLAASAERWVFHLDDPSEASLAGVPPIAVPEPIPGRIVVATSGCAAQVALPDTGDVTSGGQPGGPAPITVLPTTVDATTMPPGRRTSTADLELVVGVAFDSLDAARLVVPDGEHVLIAGPPRSGRTTALARLVESWREAVPTGTVVEVVSRGRVARWADAIEVGELDRAVADGHPCLVVVDDAEHVDDCGGVLAALLAERRAGVLVVAAGRPDALRPLYGHWTSIVRRSRLGLLMSACTETDGDILGELLPRQRVLAPRPGLAWVVAGGCRTLVQVAMGVTVDVAATVVSSS